MPLAPPPVGAAAAAAAARRNANANGIETCRMSASSDNNGDERGDRPALNNPFLAAAVGAALLSADPAATLAAQSARGAVIPEGGSAAAAAQPTLMLSAATAVAPTGDAKLKDLLGEVRCAFFLFLVFVVHNLVVDVCVCVCVCCGVDFFFCVGGVGCAVFLSPNVTVRSIYSA